MTIQEKAKQLVRIRNEVNKAKTFYDALREKKEYLVKELIVDLDKAGFKSIKTDEAMISRQVARSLSIVDENLLIRDLKKRGLKDYVKEQIDRELWRPFATEAMNQGMKLPGTELKETEFIRFRNVKK